MFLAFALFLIPFSSAVFLNDTFISTSATNLTVNFTQVAYADQVIVESHYIYFYNFSRNNGVETLTFNLSIQNQNFTGLDLPYFSATSTTAKTITSALSASQTSNIIFTVDTCSSIGNIYYTPSGSSQQTIQRSSYSCSDGVVTLNTITVNNGANQLTFDYSCSTFTTTGFSIIMLFAGLIIIVFLGLYIRNKGMELNVMDIVIMFVLLMVVIALWQISGQNLGSACPVAT